MKQRNSYTLRLIKWIDDSGSAIEVENYLVNKSTKIKKKILIFIFVNDTCDTSKYCSPRFT